jgi:predicted ArsR family transcriptional regulator
MARKPGPRRKRQETRNALVRLLKEDGPQEAKTLAEQLEVSTMAVRQHIYALQEEGLVSFTKDPRPVGRPAKLWQLTEAAQDEFPDAHAQLIEGWIAALESSLGEAALDQVLRASLQPQIARYRKALAGRDTLRKRLKGLTALRTEEGYMAELKAKRGGPFRLIENHCPVLKAARSCTALCDIELELFQQVTGDLATVRRVEHVLADGHRCAFEFEALEV